MPTQTTFPEPRFEVTAGERDGYPVVAVINVALAEYGECPQYPWLLELEISALELADRGMPNMAEVDQLNAIEERLQAELSENGAHFISRQTWNGRRMLDYYVADGPVARRHLDKLIQQGEFSRTVTMQISEDRTWETWMPTLIRMNQPTAEGTTDYDQAVFVSIPLGGGEFGSDEEQEAVLELADALSEVITESGTGEFDGYEFGNFAAMLFAYGEDVNLLLAAIEPTLRDAPVAQQATITKSYGLSDPDTAYQEIVEF